MANNTATVWGGQTRMGRGPADTELLVGDANGNFQLTPASPILPSANIQTLLDGISSVQGSVLYRSASAWSALAPGTAGRVLTTNGAGANPTWSAASPWNEGVKTSADQTVTNSITPVSATDMSFSATTGQYYSFEFGLVFKVVTTATTGGGARIRFSGPNGTLVFGPGNAQAGAGAALSGGGSTSPVIVISASAVAGTNYYALNVLGTFDCTSDGSVQLAFAEATAAASTSTTLVKGSWLRYRTVP